jgi:hypothetical protein
MKRPVYSESVFVASGIRYAMRMRHIMLSYIYIYIWNINFILIFSTKYV